MIARELRHAAIGPETGEIYPQVMVMPERCQFHLHPDARPTDLLSQSYLHEAGLLVSVALHDLLAGHALQPHRAHEAHVFSGRAPYDYRWLGLDEEAPVAALDFGRSRFSEAGAQARIDSADDLRAATLRLSERPGERLEAERLAFAPGTPEWDLFCLQLAPRRYFVTGPLAEALRASGLTGFEVAADGPELA